MEKLTFEPMKIEGQRKKNPHLMPCNINKLMVWQGTLIPFYLLHLKFSVVVYNSKDMPCHNKTGKT